MIVVDTHAWIWWATESPKLPAPTRRRLDRAQQVGVSAISCWEVAFLVIRGRLRLDRDVAAWVNAALRRPRTELLPLDPVIAVDAAHLSAFGGDPADHIIVATVRHHGAKLATADAAIASSGLVDVIWR